MTAGLRFISQLRISNPWKYKVPLLFAFTYFFIGEGVVDSDVAWYSFVCAIATTLGFAGIAYLTNDLSDRASDEKAGKENVTRRLAKWQLTGLFVLFTALALLPWGYLPWDGISLVLIALEFLLFVVYAFPPFRLKERGIAGLIADALYAHVVPAVLASWTFFMVADRHYSGIYLFLIVLSSWQLISGLRNILFHQLKDHDNDLLSETRTVATRLGKEATGKFIRVLLPLELFGFLAFLWVLSLSIPWLIYAIPVLFLWAFLRFFLIRAYKTEEGSKRVANIFLDDLYIQWIPLLFLVSIIFVKTRVTWILFTHLLLFRNGLKSFGRDLLKLIRNTWLVRRLFGFDSYVKGLLLHVVVLCLYIGVFAVVYYQLESHFTDPDEFFRVQLMLSQGLIIVILMHLAALIYYRKEQTIRTIREFVFEPGSPQNLAIFRIIAFLLILMSINGDVFGSYIQWSHLPHSARVGLPFIGWLVDWLPISPEIYRTMAIIATVLAWLILVGFKTRIALFLYLPVALYLWGVPNFFGKLNHSHIMVWVPILLAFSRCADTYSIDAWLKRKKGLPKAASFEYGLPLRMTWILMAIIYCCSGFHKLWDTGLYWALSDNLHNQILLEWVEHYDTVAAFRIDEYPVLLRFGAIGVLIMEIIYPLFIVKPVLRGLALISSWSLHLIAGMFLYIDFANLRRMHLSYIDWRKWSLRLRGKQREPLPEIRADMPTLMRMPLLYVGGMFIVMNLTLGILQISSWPFSTYPSYSSVVPPYVELLEMHPIDGDGREVDVQKLGQEQHFRWENIRPFEQRIASKVAEGDTAQLAGELTAYWDLWRTKVQGLEAVRSVEIYLIKTPTKPEKRDSIISRQYLGTVRIAEE